MYRDLKEKIVSKVIKDITDFDEQYTELTDQQLKDKIDVILEKVKEKSKIDDVEIYKYIQGLTFKERPIICLDIFNRIRGLDILGSIISDENITEVMINGYDTIFVEKNGKLIKLNDKFESSEKLKTIITKVVSEAGREVNESKPIVDTRLSDGSRVNVVLPPIALNGPIITIRRFPKEVITMEKLIEFGSITPEVAEFLKKLVEAKYNIFVSGGTGSGKTTFLNALSNFIPSDERVITIEDSAELQIKKIPNLVRLETRNAGVEGSTAVTIRDLIRASLRMRPERIVVGEVRGEEALDMLQAMNTGHDGSLSTGHANSTKDMLTRLETMVLCGAEGLPLDAIRQQIASALDIIIHLSRMRDHSRKTIEITEVVGYENNTIKLNPLFKFVESKESTTKKVIGSIERTTNKMINVDKFINAGIKVEI